MACVGFGVYRVLEFQEFPFVGRRFEEGFKHAELEDSDLELHEL